MLLVRQPVPLLIVIVMYLFKLTMFVFAAVAGRVLPCPPRHLLLKQLVTHFI